MENLNKKWVIYTLIGIIISPILISTLCNLADLNQIKLFNAGKNSDWISFWGSMLGSVFGVVGTFLVLQIQIKKESERFDDTQNQLQNQIIEEKKRFELTQIDNTFFHMLDLFQKVQDNINKENFSTSTIDIDDNFEFIKREIDIDIFEKIIDEIATNKAKYSANKNDEYIQKIFEEKNQVLKNEIKSDVNEMVATMGNIDNTHPDWTFKSCLRNIEASIKHNSFAEFNSAVNDLENITRSGAFTLSEDGFSKVKKAFELNSDLIITQDEYNYTIEKDDDILIIVDEVFSKYHSYIGNYLRVFHRLVKQIMSSKLEMKKKKEYLGIIRALLSGDELLVVFYNTFYSTRGEGLKAQLSLVDENGYKTEFFADKRDMNKLDIQNNGKIDLPFFKYQNLIFKNNDLSKIESLVNDN